MSGARTGAAAAFVVAIICLAATSARALEPDRPGQQAFIRRAVFAEGRLWLLTDAGDLSTVIPGSLARQSVTLPAPVQDICEADGRPTVVTGRRDGGGDWALMRRDREQWARVTTIRGGRDAMRAMSCDTDGVLLLTWRQLIEVNMDGRLGLRLQLSGAPHRGVVTALRRTAGGAYYALDAGEWGGGLWRIDLASGAVAPVQTAGADRGEALSSDCTPVNGLEAEPGKPECLVAAVGLAHFVLSGGLVEVCGDHIRTIYEKRVVNEFGGEASESMAFFGLTHSRGHLVAAGIDGLYDVAADESVAFSPFPVFRSVGGVQISFLRPDVVVVRTEINERDSVSGSTPLVVPR